MWLSKNYNKKYKRDKLKVSFRVTNWVTRKQVVILKQQCLDFPTGSWRRHFILSVYLGPGLLGEDEIAGKTRNMKPTVK